MLNRIHDNESWLTSFAPGVMSQSLITSANQPHHNKKIRIGDVIPTLILYESLFEELGGKYERQGDYLIPCLTVPAEEEQAIGIWGQRHLDYLKQYRKVTYTNLLTSGRLNAYLADINRQAQERFERLIEGMKQAQGITEQLKAENALEWTGCLNNIRACAREIVEKEIIFA